MAHDVFVSHSSKDKPTADAVCAMLESQGIRCWIAPRDILPGMDWGEAIVEAIKGARVMVLVFSSSANESPQIKREVERAVNKGVSVIPLRIEDVAPTASLEYFISTPHWLDAFTPPLEKHLRYLAQIIHQILGTPQPADPAVAPAAPLPSASAKPGVPTAKATAKSEPRRNRPQITLLAGAVGLVVLLVAGWWFGIEAPRRELVQRAINAERARREMAESNSVRMAEAQRQMKAEMEAAQREEEKRKTEEAARIAEERRKTEEAAKVAEAKRSAEEAARITAEKRLQEAKAAEAARIAEAEKQKAAESATLPKTSLASNQDTVVPVTTTTTTVKEVEPAKTSPTVFDLIKEANGSLGEDSKDRLFYARSERSLGEFTPSTWKLGFFDPTALFKVVEIKFRSGQKTALGRPGAMLEMYNLDKVLDRKRINIDSDRALQMASKEPLLKNLTLKSSEMKLESVMGGPVWRIKLWAAKIRNPNDQADLGEIQISADDGKVLRRDLHPERVN